MVRTPDRSADEHQNRVIPWLYHMHRVYESHKRTNARRRLERIGRVEPESDDDDWPGLQSEEDDSDGVGLVETLAMLLVWVFKTSYGKRIRLTGVMVTVYFSVVYQGYTIVPSRSRWTPIQLEPGATAFVAFDGAKSPSCSAVLLWEARTWGDLPFYIELLREHARTRFLSNHSVDLLSAMRLNSTNTKSEVVPVDSVPGHPLCNSTDVIFSEKFALKGDEYLARHYYLVAGSLWTYTLKAHVMAPAQTLHMSWDDFMRWKRDPKIPGHAEPLGIRSDVQSDKHGRGGHVVSVEWPIEKEGRFVVLLLPAATTRVNNQTNTEGALGGITHHILRKAHCSRCNAANRTNYRPVGAIIAMPGKDQRSEHVLFSTGYFWGAGGLSSGRLKTSNEAWRCRSGFRFYEAWGLLVGWPLGPHVLVVTMVAASLSLFLAASQQQNPSRQRHATKPMPSIHATSNNPESNTNQNNTITGASLKRELPGGPKMGGTEKSAKSEDQAKFPSQRQKDPRSLLQLMLSMHERQYAAFEKVARSKRLIVFSGVPWPSLDLFKEQLRQVNASGVHSAATKTAKMWSCRWHPDKWGQYNLGTERDAILSRVTEVAKEINSVPICISSNDAQLLRYQTNCPVCSAIMHFELAREDKGRRARIKCPRCSQTLEAATGLD